MKKLINILFCFLLIVIMPGCSKENKMEKAIYEIHNTTGSKVVELYIYEVESSDKGKNYAEGGLDVNKTIVINKEAPKEKTENIFYVLEFRMENGETEKFDNLAFEMATIELLNIDEAAGATQIRFVTNK